MDPSGLWEDRVRSLGAAAVQDLQSNPARTPAWARYIRADAVGQEYVSAVLDHLARKADNPYAPENTILREHMEADRDLKDRRRNLTTTIRITTTKVFGVALLAGVIGFAIPSGTQHSIPEWLELTTVAAFATSIGAAGSGIRKSQLAVAEAAVDAALEGDRRRLSNLLNRVVGLLLQALEPATAVPRAPPPALAERVARARELIAEGLHEQRAAEVVLTLDERARQAITNACNHLLHEADTQDLEQLDPPCMGWLKTFAGAVKEVTEEPHDTSDVQTDLGASFLHALAAASCLNVCLQPNPRIDVDVVPVATHR
jgi:hypothetical protein